MWPCASHSSPVGRTRGGRCRCDDTTARCTLVALCRRRPSAKRRNGADGPRLTDKYARVAARSLRAPPPPRSHPRAYGLPAVRVCRARTIVQSHLERVLNVTTCYEL